MPKAIIHFLDSSRGQYIPRDFAQIIKRGHIQCVSLELLDNRAKENSNNSEFYWEDWCTVCGNAKIVHDGVEYTLHHDGDLWLINGDAMTNKEKQNFGFEE